MTNIESLKPAPSRQASPFEMIRLLTVVSLVCGFLIVTTHISTLTRIRHNQEIIMRESVTQLLPGIQKQITYTVEPSGRLQVLEGSETTLPRLFAGYDGAGNLIGVVVEATERGYADNISAMYAYSPDKQTITGFKVVEMRETPGLGDRITHDKDFQANFDNLDAKLDPTKTQPLHPIRTVKHGTKKNPWEIDAISGATISSRAIGRMLQKSVQATAPVIVGNLDRIRRGN